MALQSSGQISLNDLHVEAGGTSGTQASMNDSDIRGLLSAAANSQMTFSGFYGASSSSTVHSSTMTVGTLNQSSSYSGVNYGFNDYSGSSLIGSDFGSLTNSSFTVGSNSSVETLRWNTIASSLVFTVGSASALSNSGWSTLQIGSTSFSRSAASFSSTSLTNFDHNFVMQWTWLAVSPNPIGTSGTKSILIS